MSVNISEGKPNVFLMNTTDGHRLNTFFSGIENVFKSYTICYDANGDEEFDRSKYEKKAVDKAATLLQKLYAYKGMYTGEMEMKAYRDEISKMPRKEWTKFILLLYYCEFIEKHINHLSPTEHALISFHISGVSRALSHQLVRHRIASYSQRSQRYINENNPLFILPPKIGKNEKAKKIYIDTLECIMNNINKIKDLGDPNIKAEDIRFLLPNATATTIMVSMNIRSWMNFFNERCCHRAQWEIHTVANMIFEIVRDLIPFVFETSGPKCEKLGYCPEDKSCGRKIRNQLFQFAPATITEKVCIDKEELADKIAERVEKSLDAKLSNFVQKIEEKPVAK